MDYSQYQPYAITPCQIGRMHTNLNGSQHDYIHSCNNCLPANSFFTLAPNQCTESVVMDGSGSFNEQNHFIEIYRVNGVGQVGVAGQYYYQWFSGEIGKVTLNTYCNYNFQYGQVYRIKLAVQKRAPDHSWCTQWDESVKYVTTYSNPCKIKLPGLETRRVAGGAMYAFVYPNPASQKTNLTYTLPNKDHVKITLYDLKGQMIQQVFEGSVEAGENTLRMNLQTTSKGIYFCHIRSSHDSKVVRFTVK